MLYDITVKKLFLHIRIILGTYKWSIAVKKLGLCSTKGKGACPEI